MKDAETIQAARMLLAEAVAAFKIEGDIQVSGDEDTTVFEVHVTCKPPANPTQNRHVACK